MGHNQLGLMSFWKGENDTERGIGGRERTEETQVKDGRLQAKGRYLGRSLDSQLSEGNKTPLQTP